MTNTEELHELQREAQRDDLTMAELEALVRRLHEIRRQLQPGR